MSEDKGVYLKEECGYCRWCQEIDDEEFIYICILINLDVEIDHTCSKWEAYDE